MQLTGLLDLLRSSGIYRDLLTRLENHSAMPDLGVIRAARPFLLAALAQEWSAPIIYITGRVDRAYNVSEQLPVWISDRTIYRFAEPTALFYERSPWVENVIRGRIATLAALTPPEEISGSEGITPVQKPIIITSARAIMQRTMPVNQFRKATMILKPGQRHTLDVLLNKWVKLGYEPVSVVIEPGTFSRRGGVVDIFPLASDKPIRIDFFDDEIDSIRVFDPSTQRSADKLGLVAIPPAREVLPEQMPPLASHLAPYFANLSSASEDMTSPFKDAEAMTNGVAFPYLEHYIPYVYPQPVSLLDYAPPDALVVVEDWAELRDTIAGIEEGAIKSRTERLSANQLAADHPLPYLTWDALAEEFEHRTTVHFGSMSYIDDEGEEAEAPTPIEDSGISFRTVFAPEERFGGQLKPLLARLRNFQKTGDCAVVVSQQSVRVADLWREQEGFVPTVKDILEPPMPGTFLLIDGALGEGWKMRLPGIEVRLLTDAEIFGWNRPEPRRRKTVTKGRLPESSYADLNAGDFVVHQDYGIGRFGGMRRRTIEGNEREYLVIEYAGTDMVFVPIHQADRLTRYVGPDDRPPSLSRLGKPDWAKVTSQARKAVEDEAKELLALYAQRVATTGFAYPPDTPWQHELEASFPYVETDDQVRAIREVKADMERPLPMDRLICGEVGYGKTEVALRAAFKAVMGGKQVALLVPTTVLAQQHYENFSQRLKNFPVKVEVISRFRSKDEQRVLLPLITNGEVDIIIGTHRLLQDDVTFNNLGLVIIDEEQRFGVTHKESLKKLRTEVDVLTLTATPIPRTLYMSLTGVRDITMIQTPPEERLPIVTHVGPFDDRLVRQAVIRELERGGQVFYVHNRINTMDAVRERLEQIVPEARVVEGHGQMDERLLEKVMGAFGRGEYDILLSTSIIENGIDIPNANTLIVDRADWFGMSQLYQLRGRVGRSAQQAFTYFFHPSNNRLTDEARTRLEALAEYTELGAGYQIAMRDLELRGAGDILSTRQTGHVAAVGLHLYTQLLTHAVQQLKSSINDEIQAPIAVSTVTIDLPLPAYIPNDWISEMALRLQIYRRVGSLSSMEDVDMMRDELRDRFGTLPPAVDGLMYGIDVKIMAQKAGATAVITTNDIIHIKLPYLAEINREKLEADLGKPARVTRTAVMVPTGDETWQLQLLDVLAKLAQRSDTGAGL